MIVQAPKQDTVLHQYHHHEELEGYVVTVVPWCVVMSKNHVFDDFALQTRTRGTFFGVGNQTSIPWLTRGVLEP